MYVPLEESPCIESDSEADHPHSYPRIACSVINTADDDVRTSEVQNYLDLHYEEQLRGQRNEFLCQNWLLKLRKSGGRRTLDMVISFYKVPYRESLMVAALNKVKYPDWSDDRTSEDRQYTGKPRDGWHKKGLVVKCKYITSYTIRYQDPKSCDRFLCRGSK